MMIVGLGTSSVNLRRARWRYYIVVDGRRNAQGHHAGMEFRSNHGPVPSIIGQLMKQSAALGDTVQPTVTFDTPNAEVQWFFNGQPILGGTMLPGSLGNTSPLPT
jgi:hypothetical protein